MSERPACLAFVAGTGTEVGKTWWAAAMARALRSREVPIAVRKPVQSGLSGEPSDAHVLAAALGAHPDDVCPPHRSYGLPLAPPMAAAELGAPPFFIHDLVAETSWPGGRRVGLVEGAGGPRSPVADDGDNVDLARALDPDLVVLVADPGLGTINAVRLSVDAFAPFRVVVALNRFDADNSLHELNQDWLARRSRLDVVTEPVELADRLAVASG